MVAPKKRIKMFNKLLQEFIDNYNKMYDLETPFVKIREISVLNTFKDEINFVSELFFNCDQSALKNITLCKQLKLDTLKISEENKVSIWSYLHNLFLLTQEAPDKSQLIEKTKKAIECLTNTEPDLSNLFQDIAGEVSKSLQGKDISSINPMELMNALMAGNSNINGIDFMNIIKNTTEKLQNKIDSGEIDTNKLQKQAENLISNPVINQIIHSHVKK